MYDRVKNLLDCFDEIFNDNFIETASEEEIELRFEYLKDLCKRDHMEFNSLLDELEFSCNSYIDEVTRL